MNTLKFTPFLLVMLIMMSCSDDDEVAPLAEVESTTFENLHAPQEGGRGEPISGSFTKFDFETGQITDSDTEWDIAFRGATIAVNGGTETGTIDEPARTSDAGITIVNGTFEDVTEIAEDTGFDQDSQNGFAIPTGSGNGWYNYDFTTNILSPIPGKILLVETTNANYAKVEILSYYEDAPSDIDPFQDESRYYTFRYAYNPNERQVTFN
ncbi:HmuY family protein [Psychroflexus sp. CAK8W]|uniref:HmuY family protein n=1 Tax=Psychroflexus longus TaxID=2873596 RepID=A0ABS7XG89_9FLAO|nr:HmuY family protein [Psychroflexus longus]MBZ9777974.1 HmuY family protein [Psychroflexus longus]